MVQTFTSQESSFCPYESQILNLIGEQSSKIYKRKPLLNRTCMPHAHSRFLLKKHLKVRHQTSSHANREGRRNAFWGQVINVEIETNPIGAVLNEVRNLIGRQNHSKQLRRNDSLKCRRGRILELRTVSRHLKVYKYNPS